MMMLVAMTVIVVAVVVTTPVAVAGIARVYYKVDANTMLRIHVAYA